MAEHDATRSDAALLHVNAENFLSLRDVQLDLERLTVLVGPNGSGKSNLLQLFRFLGEIARTDLEPAIEAFGGYERIRFRGAAEQSRISIKIRAMATKHASHKAADEYEISFGLLKNRFLFRWEKFKFKRIGGAGRRISLRGRDLSVFSPSRKKETALTVSESTAGLAMLQRLGEQYDAPQVKQLADLFQTFRVFEPDVAAVRRPSERRHARQLASNAANLADFLGALKEEDPDRFSLIEDDMRAVLPGFRRLVLRELGGASDAVSIEIEETGLPGATPLAAASFGTIRALALFAMLNDPYPPPLTCVEEIDHGLHPYALDRVVERLRDATTRTQIIVATHSPALVNRLEPEELVIFERDTGRGCTRIPARSPRIIRDQMSASDLRLGELWFSGTLGGVPDA